MDMWHVIDTNVMFLWLKKTKSSQVSKIFASNCLFECNPKSHYIVSIIMENDHKFFDISAIEREFMSLHFEIKQISWLLSATEYWGNHLHVSVQILKRVAAMCPLEYLLCDNPF